MRLTKDLEMSSKLVEQARALYNSKISDFQNLKANKDSDEIKLVGFGEVKKHKDEQIKDLKSKLIEVQQSFEIEKNEHSSTKIDSEKFETLYEKLKMTYEDMNEKYHINNKQRNQLELQMQNQVEV